MAENSRKPVPAGDINDPDRDNAEQNETGTQAQDVAEDALENPADARGDAETEHGGRTNPAQIIPDDAQDLVDHMKDMNRSGRIDMGAFDGEDNMDDEDGSVPDYGGEGGVDQD
ncbi:MAG: hypothetical protein J7494_11325 [Sphingobium sp.]|nr:hypothetical protein [Sphingobium sp.]